MVVVVALITGGALYIFIAIKRKQRLRQMKAKYAENKSVVDIEHNKSETIDSDRAFVDRSKHRSPT